MKPEAVCIEKTFKHSPKASKHQLSYVGFKLLLQNKYDFEQMVFFVVDRCYPT